MYAIKMVFVCQKKNSSVFFHCLHLIPNLFRKLDADWSTAVCHGCHAWLKFCTVSEAKEVNLIFDTKSLKPDWPTYPFFRTFFQPIRKKTRSVHGELCVIFIPAWDWSSCVAVCSALSCVKTRRLPGLPRKVKGERDKRHWRPSLPGEGWAGLGGAPSSITCKAYCLK